MRAGVKELFELLQLRGSQGPARQRAARLDRQAVQAGVLKACRPASRARRAGPGAVPGSDGGMHRPLGLCRIEDDAAAAGPQAPPLVRRHGGDGGLGAWLADLRGLQSARPDSAVGCSRPE